MFKAEGDKYVYHVDRWFGTWWDLYFSGVDPLMIRRAKVVSIDAGRN